MAITEIEDRITDIINQDNFDQFIYDFLGVYDFPKATITKLRKGTNNLADVSGEVYLKNRLYFKQTDHDLMQSFVNVKDKVNQLGSKPRYIMVTDFKNVLAVDTKTGDTLDVEFERLPQKFEFFLAWNGIEKADFDKENPADIRAAERFAKLYDVVVKDNPDASRHGLNLFLIRVLFCLFAEDTAIFEKNLFTNRIKELTKEDGSDLDNFFKTLFGVLDVEKSNRSADTPSWLADFPYVDGDLFKDPHESIKFNQHSRKLIIDAGEKLEWDQINPDILGSMIQAVASEDSRSHLGMHYTSVPNIMKVIKPLFLDNLRQEFEKAKGNQKKLDDLYDRIGKIKFMDPACGSGNFLIITYKELRQLEIDILKELNGMGIATMYVPSVTLDQFYGIEIDDFACDVTRLSLWIAEHQMNKQLEREIDNAVRPTLPLQHAGAIVCGNALRVSWNTIMPKSKNGEYYLFGNPPYLGERLSNEQKADRKKSFSYLKAGVNSLDYVTCWFRYAAEYISGYNGKFAFVATNSILQGRQVEPFYKGINNKFDVEPFFLYTSFKWQNNAKNNANVIVIILGYANCQSDGLQKKIITGEFRKIVQNITPYGTDSANNTIVKQCSQPIDFINNITVGCRPNDKQGLIFSREEYNDIKKQYPGIEECFRKYVGGKEFTNSTFRYILWLNDDLYDKYKWNPIITKRMNFMKKIRMKQHKELKPFELFNNRNRDLQGWFIPQASSSNRKYIPMGMLDSKTVISDPNFILYNPKLWECGILMSKIHLVWISAIGGKLKNDYRYSNTLIYNTFPVPRLSTRRKNEIEELVWKILDIRDEEGGTLAELYGSPLAEENPKPMNPRLLAAHQELDEVVDRAYRDRPFTDDNERLSLLLNMYSQKIKEENNEK